MMNLAHTSNTVIFLAIFVQHSVEWGANQGHFTAVESEDVSNERISIEKFSTASELTCSQKCLWLDECFFTKYDTDERRCELLQKINHDDFDSGALLTKKEKLQRKDASSSSLENAQSVNAVNAGESNGCSVKGTYISCTEALSKNCYQHGIYPICLKSLKSPVTIECKLHDNGSSVAVFRHDNENATLVNGFEARGSYGRVFNYNLPLESITAVINQSSNCMQFTKAECFHAHLSGDTWLSDRFGQKLFFWGGGPSDGTGCSCGIHQGCANRQKKCNCDSNDEKWRFDEGFIRKKYVLPITAINVGDTGSKSIKEQLIYTVGSLVCFD